LLRKDKLNSPWRKNYRPHELNLKELAILASERVLKIRIQAIKRVLTKVFNLIPRVESQVMLICARKCQLYTEAAIHCALGFAAVCFNCTILFVQTNKLRVTGTLSTSISFPV
jgi:hypothetical protein